MSAEAGRGEARARLRLFFALWPTAQEQQALAAACGAGVQGYGGRRIAPENLHATLVFLGNVQTVRVPQLHALARGVAGQAGGGPLPLRFAQLEYWMRPKILCATDGSLAAAPGAGALADELKRATLAAGFAPDLKPFRAHVTVVRKVAHAPEAQPLAPVSWNCAAFALVASRTGSGGSVYSVVETYPLDRTQKAHTEA